LVFVGVGQLEGDLALDDFLHRDLEVRAAVALDQGAVAIHELAHTVLDQGSELEPAAEGVDHAVVFEGFDHGRFASNRRGYRDLAGQGRRTQRRATARTPGRIDDHSGYPGIPQI